MLVVATHVVIRIKTLLCDYQWYNGTNTNKDGVGACDERLCH